MVRREDKLCVTTNLPMPGAQGGICLESLTSPTDVSMPDNHLTSSCPAVLIAPRMQYTLAFIIIFSPEIVMSLSQLVCLVIDAKPLHTVPVIHILFEKAHRYLLAARSPVFSAELFGMMKESDVILIAHSGLESTLPSACSALIDWAFARVVT
ncbi:hypothetical protein PR202_ga00253 [Eleusine coracana subsp. coracana]|uniref:BTB domain-containing protein n=1 Tax=Eleusine coracana subsp. coracana TaxID=191504 RepID=A0AAV5BBU1_ELECO|nr:hypothetical protein PR202_ga00253 [Eleusine coracana subsp. coracana]